MCKQQISDNELVALFIKGDENALQKLIIRHEKKVYTSKPTKVRWGLYQYHHEIKLGNQVCQLV